MKAQIPKTFKKVSRRKFIQIVDVMDYRRAWWYNGAFYIRRDNDEQIGFYDDEHDKYYLNPRCYAQKK